MTDTRDAAHGWGRPVPLPHFKVELSPPDLSAWLPGNTGVAGFTSYAAGSAAARTRAIAY